MAGSGSPAAATAREHGLSLAAKYILGGLSVIFLTLAAARIGSDRGHITPASRTWLLTGIIFGMVSAYLWMAV